MNSPKVIDASHIERQRIFSHNTFGPGPRTGGVIEHIKKELEEIKSAPLDLNEWVDIVILGLDGAWRTGAEPQAIIDAIIAKQEKNENRIWPDWRNGSQDHAIEHDRTICIICGRKIILSFRIGTGICSTICEKIDSGELSVAEAAEFTQGQRRHGSNVRMEAPESSDATTSESTNADHKEDGASTEA